MSAQTNLFCSAVKTHCKYKLFHSTFLARECEENNSLLTNLSTNLVSTFAILGLQEETPVDIINEITLSATDVLAPTTMKNAAKCDTSCELRNPVSHQNFERILHFLWGVCLLECLFIPTSTPTPVVLLYFVSAARSRLIMLRCK